jgi:nonribosomal peptide synthetase CepB
MLDSPERATAVGAARWVVLGAPAGLDHDALVTAVGALVDTHDVLRARVEDGESGQTLSVGERGTVEPAGLVVRVDAADLAGEEDLARAANRAAGEAAERLDPRAGDVLRVVWLDAGPDRVGRLALVAHRLVVDEESWPILVTDLFAAYQAAAGGREPELEPVPTSFRRWAQALTAQTGGARRAEELGAWTALLGEPEAPLGERDLDPARDTVRTLREESWTVPAEQAAALTRRTPLVFHCDVREVLLAGLTAAVATWRPAAAEGLLVDVQGRRGESVDATGLDLSRTVGWCTSAHPVRLTVGELDLDEVLAGGPDAGLLLKAVKEQARSVPGDGFGYGLLRHLDATTALADAPPAQIGFTYLDRPDDGTDTDVEAPTEPIAAWETAGQSAVSGRVDPDAPATHPLEADVRVQDSPDGPELTLTLRWPGELLTAADVEELGECWLEALEGLANHTTDPAAGGHTPSDFTLLDLDQDEVDELDNF